MSPGDAAVIALRSCVVVETMVPDAIGLLGQATGETPVSSGTPVASGAVVVFEPEPSTKSKPNRPHAAASQRAASSSGRCIRRSYTA